MTNVALGKKVLEDAEDVVNGHLATDGNTTKYDHGTGFASFKWSGTLTVDLEEVHSLYVIRILLWDGRGHGKEQDERRYRYGLYTSTTGEDWVKHYVSDDEGSNGWQVFEAEKGPIPARYVRVEGLKNTANSAFHVVQVEAWNRPDPPAPPCQEKVPSWGRFPNLDYVLDSKGINVPDSFLCAGADPSRAYDR